MYKTKLLKYIVTQNIIQRTNKIQEKIESHTLTPVDITEVNTIDEFTTKGIISAEKNLFSPKKSPIVH